MNLRIRQLTEQAIVSVDTVTGNEALDDELAKMYIPDRFAEKFAQLIVRECADAIELNTMQIPKRSISEIRTILRKHFGVEE